MQRNNTAHRSCAPTQNDHPTPPTTATTEKPGTLPIPLREIEYTTTPKRLRPGKRLQQIIRSPFAWIAGVVILSWLLGYSYIAGGLVFAVALYFVNTFVDAKMAGGAK